jgi:hypothetical protein
MRDNMPIEMREIKCAQVTLGAVGVTNTMICGSDLPSKYLCSVPSYKLGEGE